MSEAPDPQAEAPVVEAEVPAVETHEAEAPAEAAEAGEEVAAEAAEPTPEEPKKPKSPVAQLQGRVGHLTKTIHEKDATLAEQARQIEAYKALLESQGKPAEGETAPAAQPVGQPLPGTPEFDKLVDDRASQKARQTAFTAACNSIVDAGEKAHGAEFTEAITNLNALGLMNEQVVEAAMATDSAADVLHFLGTDLDEAARITALPPIRMAAELTKLANKLGAAAADEVQISRAPAPIKPLGGAVNPEIDIADVAAKGDMSAYVAARKKQGARWAK